MLKRVILSLLTIVFLSSIMGCQSVKNTPQEPEVSTVENEEINDDEFNRSTAAVTITKAEFNADKKEILKIIAELDRVMKNYNFEEWLTYIDPHSITYWTNPYNLRNATKRLPNKAIKLNNLNDYFMYVFVPSRKDRKVDEIRYISLDSVKAVQMKDETDIVYYNFVKIDGKWMVKLPNL